MLKLMNGENFIKDVVAGAQFTLPNGDVVSPAYAGWESGAFSLVEVPPPVVEPPTAEELLAQERASMTMTFAQLLIGLVAEEWITQAEGVAWLGGTAPAAVTTLIDALPAEQQFPALARAVRPSEVLRTDPLVIAMATAEGMTALETDDFFRTYRNA